MWNILLITAFIVLSPVVITAQTEETFITQIRDLVIGSGASYTEVELYIRGEKTCEHNCENHNTWIHVASNVTDINGRIPNLVTAAQFPLGVYKLIFQTGKYYDTKQLSTLYTYLEIIFKKSTLDQILIVVSLSPYGYTYYKGVNGIK